MGAQIDRQYMNILVFAIVAGIISLVIMIVTIAAGDGALIKRITPLIVTIEAGLLLIIAHAIYRSVKHIRRLNDARDNIQDARLQVSTCPDYWTLTSQDADGKRVCTNTFKDSLDPRTRYTISGRAGGSPSQVRSVRLADYADLTVREACEKAKREVQAPWQALDPLCV
jgi:hypothetical protein